MALILIFGGIGVLAVTFLSNNIVGYFSLVVGISIGVIGTEFYYVPKFTKKWERMGIPGEPKTPEQQKVWEQQKEKESWTRNLLYPIGFVIAAKLFKDLVPPNLAQLLIPAMIGSVLGYLLRYAYLVYQRRGKLGR